ncbi:hypothetical protein B2J88_44610 [Rhodococcus sp. SRB_17]|nr:hypothetical protein [Rhodococcus sp. SRB_17]
MAITPDAWSQIMSHAPQTEERRKREQEIAIRRQRGVEELLHEGRYPTTPLRFVKRIEPPSPGMEIDDTFTRYDGAIVVTWRNKAGDRAITVETEADSLPSIPESSFPGYVDYIVPMPGGNWLGTQARVKDPHDCEVPVTAWVLSPHGEIVASGCFGDASLRPVVGTSGQIWVPYFDEKPFRERDGAWYKTDDDRWEFYIVSAVGLDDVAENSAYGHYTAGYTGMTVYNTNLEVIDRHEGTDIVEVYATHTDGNRFWYVGYPNWVIDSYGPDGQRPPVPATSHKGATLIASGNQIARFGGAGPHRDSLFVRQPDGSEAISIVTFPDGRPLEQGGIATWGPYLHYFDGPDWYVVTVFGDEHRRRNRSHLSPR